MFLTEQVQEKWAELIDHPDLPPIKNPYIRAVTTCILENQDKAFKEERRMLSEDTITGGAPLNSTGAGINNYDPILISLVRRSLPNLVAYDICGVQPMTGPTGLIFAMRSRYGGNTNPLATQANEIEALFNEANTSFSASNWYGNTAGTILQTGNDPVSSFSSNTANVAGYTYMNAMPTSVGEALGTGYGSNPFAEMAFSIEKITVTAGTRALQAQYTLELAQDLKAIHGLDAETELANILSTEILAEINREVIRTIYTTAVVGAQYQTAVAGTFDLDVDANGRWSVEKFKGLIFQIERECNAIAKATRRGRGNVILVSSDVASALAMSGVLQYTPALSADLTVDDTGNTFCGLLHNRIKVFIDPYFGGSAAGDELVTVGYRGTSPYDAGIFYCPYVPLQMVRAVSPDQFQPRIGFKTRYGMVANPYAQGTVQGLGALTPRSNVYYRIFRVANLL